MTEETAWEFIPQSIVGIYMYPNQHSDITYLRVCFSGACEKYHPEQALDDGIIQAAWFSQEEIKQNMDRMRSPMVQQCINLTYCSDAVVSSGKKMIQQLQWIIFP